jgi:hypothetical protein
MSKHIKIQSLTKFKGGFLCFMVSKEKLEISSWCIHSSKNCQKWIKNEKVMALQIVHGQKVEKMPHPTLGIRSENTQTVLVCYFATFRVPR